MELSLKTEKFIIMLGMLVATFCFGLIPKKLVGPARTSERWKFAISMMSCFSGGVFVAACLLDLFPDVRESIDHVLDEIEVAYHTTVDYPVAEFIIVMGFFLVLLIEQMVLEFGGVEQSGTPEENSPLLGDASSRRSSNHGTFDDGSEDSDEPSHGGAHDHSHDHHSHHVLDHSSMRSIILLIALTFHSLFEGLAIGLQEIKGELISIFTAVIIHKAIMAFSLGLNMAQSNLSLKTFLLSMLTFSLASPIGMGLGICLTDLEQSLGRDIANGVLQGLAGGTFLYITFIEVLPSELDNKYSRMLKLLFIFLGYTSICILLFITH